MAGLETLAKISKRKVEEQQKDIAKLAKVMQQMQERYDHLEQSINQEMAAAIKASDAEMLARVGNFQLRAKAEMVEIEDAQKDAEEIMERKKNQLRLLFAEQKRYEIMHEENLRKEKLAQNKKEQDALDEIAIMRSPNAG